MAISNAEIASKLEDYLTQQFVFIQQYRDWYAGPADGGPSGDGLYPLTANTGITQMVPSPAKVMELQAGDLVALGQIGAVVSLRADVEAMALAGQFGIVHPDVATGNAWALSNAKTQFNVRGPDGDGVLVYTANADVNLAAFVAKVGGKALGYDGPMPDMPSEFLHWTPRLAYTDSAGNIVRIECDLGTLIATPTGYVAEGVSNPIRQTLDSQSVSGTLTVTSGNSESVSIAPLKRIDNYLLTAAVDGVFGHSNVSAPVSGNTVSVVGGWVDANAHTTWTIYANHRVAMFPPGTDLIIINTGQSWDAGSTDSNPIRDALSTTPMYPGKVLMPYPGIRSGNVADGEIGTRSLRFSAYADHIETSTNTVGGLGESPAASTANHLMREFEYMWGSDHGVRIVSLNVAHGGYAIEELGPGTPMFETVFTNALRDAIDTSISQGRRPIVIAVGMTHGQANGAMNTSTARYMQLMRTYRNAMIARIRHMVPDQYFDPAFIIDVGRFSSNNRNAFNSIMLAQSLLADEPGFTQAGEEYTTWGSLFADGLEHPNQVGGLGHPTSWGFTVIGHRRALAILHSPPLGYGYTVPRPDRTRGNGGAVWTAANKFLMYFRRTLDRGTLAIDTSGVDIALGTACDATNWGFQYWDNSGGGENSAPTVSITGCSIVAPDQIEVTLSGPPTGYRRKVICAGLKDGAGDDALRGGGRSIVYLDDGDTRLRTTLYPIPTNEGGDGNPKVLKAWMMPFELNLS